MNSSKNHDFPAKPPEFPKPQEAPQTPGRHVPDAPVLPHAPEVSPQEKPHEENVPPEIPGNSGTKRDDIN